MHERVGYRTEKDGKTRRYIVTVTVCDQETYDTGPFNFGASYEDGSLNVVMESLREIANSIPEEYRAAARCEVGSTSGYEGSHYASLTVTYERKATQDEIAAFEAKEAADKVAQVARARAEYERLKQTFGS